MTAAIQLVQEHLHSLAPRVQAYTSAELPPSRAGVCEEQKHLCRQKGQNHSQYMFLILVNKKSHRFLLYENWFIQHCILISIQSWIALWFKSKVKQCFLLSAPVRSLASRLQLDLAESNDGREQSDYGESRQISTATWNI